MEEQDQPKSKSITIVAENNRNRVTIPVTGAFISPSPDGASIVVQLYVEYRAMPNVVTMEPDENGNYNPTRGRTTTRGDWIRESQATLLMSRDIAISIGELLTNLKED